MPFTFNDTYKLCTTTTEEMFDGFVHTCRHAHGACGIPLDDNDILAHRRAMNKVRGVRQYVRFA